MLCPFCLKDVKFKKEQEAGNSAMITCPEDKEQIPPLYVREYRKYPPVVANAIGFPGHGKTVNFASLFYALKKLSPAQYWPDFYHMALDERDLQTINENVKMLEEGTLPDSTPKNFPRPTMLRVVGIPMQRDCTLLCYDTDGRCFKSPTELVRYAAFVKRAQTAIFLVSMPDLGDAEAAQEMHSLLNTYVVGMGLLEAKTQNQHLVVVYTKADEVASRFKHPWQDLREYLIRGSMNGLVYPDEYMKRMYTVSDRLREFTWEELRAYDFINMANKHFQSVEFSMISALGAKPQGNQLPVEIVPRRILDPLLWMMEKSRPSWKHTWRKWLG